MQKGLVSVVISSYNHEPYIEEAILSVLGQSYPSVELLVVDDGSTDNSVERIRRLQERHGFDFRVQQNKGLTRTLNEAFARAKGEFFAPFGSDDIMLPDRLAVQMAHMEGKPEVGICSGNMQLIRADGSRYSNADPGEHAPYRRLQFDDLFRNRKSGISAPTMLIRREAFEKAGGFNPDIRLEDLYIQLKITRLGYCVDALGVLMAKYRKHETNAHKNIRFMTESILRIYAEYSDHPDYDRVRYRFINSMFAKSAKRDHQLARELLAMLPLREWTPRTLKSLIRYVFS
ncbi:glycosyltransferase [Pseudothauera nasutitermitis]|uniref:glycosyltransferase n=1 Tax=Pseudothauera nasutitermitis TaxID=2565930 RepID=UPI002ED93C3F